jgi:hypothetical protein
MGIKISCLAQFEGDPASLGVIEILVSRPNFAPSVKSAVLMAPSSQCLRRQARPASSETPKETKKAITSYVDSGFVEVAA